MTFLQKSYGDFNKVEKPVLVTMSYEDNENELEMIPVVMQNNNDYNVVSDSKSESDDKSEENLFDVNINKEVETRPKTIINSKVVQAMKQLQALYNDDNKIVKQAAQEKSTNENLNFLIDLAM